MRIATWNLNHGGRRGSAVTRQDAALRAVVADLVVLTEPPIEWLTAGPGVVTSPAERESDRGGPEALEAWVAIVGDRVAPVGPPLPFERLAVRARAELDSEPVVIYGSVLPWGTAHKQAPRLAEPGETSLAMFERVLNAQLDDLLRLRRRFEGELLIWAGDFNQSLAGPNWGGSAEKRALLADALARLDFDAWNKNEPHARPGMCAIDLICGPAGRHGHPVHRIDNLLDGRKLTDHAGYVVEV